MNSLCLEVWKHMLTSFNRDVRSSELLSWVCNWTGRFRRSLPIWTYDMGFLLGIGALTMVMKIPATMYGVLRTDFAKFPAIFIDCMYTIIITARRFHCNTCALKHLAKWWYSPLVSDIPLRTEHSTLKIGPTLDYSHLMTTITLRP